MLSIILGSKPIRKPDTMEYLSYHAESLGGRWYCNFFFDPIHYELKNTGDEILVFHKQTPDGMVCKLTRQDNVVLFRKPFMLGLPIYYSRKSSEVLFSTHIKLLKQLGVELRENEQRLPEFFVYRYIAPPNTLFEDIFCLPLGGSLQIRLEPNQMRMEDITWPDAFEGKSPCTGISKIEEKIAEDLRNNVSFLKGYPDEVGCLLSGGVDSSILYKLSNDILSIRESHSTGYPFEDNERNFEKQYAETASAAFRSTHMYHTYSTEDYLSGLLSAIEHAEVPVHHLQSVLFALIFKNGFKPQTRVVISGQGADGVFGLSIMYMYHKYKYLFNPLMAPWLGLSTWLLGRGGFLYSYARHAWDCDYAKTNHSLWVLGQRGDKQWVKARFGVGDDAILQGRLDAIQIFQPTNVLDAFSILDVIGDVAFTQDTWGKLGMASGKYIYYPFNSPTLVKTVYEVPWNEKLAEPKRLLRNVGREIGVPDFILTRPKLSFGVHPDRWAVRGGAFEPLIKLAAPVVGEDTLRQLQSTNIHTAMTFWNLINYALWKRLWINAEPLGTLEDELRTAQALALS